MKKSALLLWMLTTAIIGLRAGNLYNIVERDNLKGLENDKGVLLIPVEYEDLGWSEGAILVMDNVIGFRRGNFWGLVSLQNQKLTDPVFTHLEPFGDQLIIAARYLPNNLDIRYGLINTRGKVQTDFQYVRLQQHGERLIACISDRNELKYGLLDRQGKTLIAFDYQSMRAVGPKTYAVAKGEKTAIFDAGGRILSAFEFDSATLFSPRYALLHGDGRQSLLDLDRVRIMSSKWKSIRTDSDGSIIAEKFPEWSVFDAAFRPNGHLYFDEVEPMDGMLLRVEAGQARAVIDSSGAVISPFTRFDIWPITADYFLLSHNSRFGVIDRKGNSILSPDYEAIRWQNGRLLVYQVVNGKRGWCLHDESGERCGDSVYDDMYWLGGMYYAVRRDRFWGVIDMMGRELVFCKYDSIVAQNSGYFQVIFLGEDAIVNDRDHWEVGPQKKEIEIIGPRRYLVRSPYGSYVAWYPDQVEFRAEYYLYPFGDFYLERTGDGKLGLVNAKGLRIAPPIYDQVWELQEDSLFYLRSGRGFSFIGREGTVLHQNDTRFLDILPMSEGYIGVRIGERWGFVDPYGRLRIANRYEGIGGYSEGLAAVRIRGKWGFIDKGENLRVQPHFGSVGKFENGVCLVEIDGRYGLIDTKGQMLLEVEYDELKPLRAGGYISVQGGKMGLISSQGRQLILPRFDRVYDLDNGAVIVERNQKYGVMTSDGLSPIPMIYDRIRFDPVSHRYYAAISGEWQRIDP